MSGALDALSLPLDGVRLIEAGAGSGKTWTLATLYLRLLLERRLTPERVLVMTFTRAATAELAGRLRARLELAERLLHEEAPAQPRDGDGAEAAATRRLLAQALAAWDGDLDGLRRHARAARHAGDLAAVSTLHGFCQRALREIGFAAGASLEAHALLENEQALREEAAADFWRARGASDAAAARLLADAWGTPQKLARALGEARWEGRRVHAPADDGAAQAARRALERAAAAVRALDGDAFAAARQAIERATVGKTRAAKGKALERIAAAVRNEAAFDPADASLLAEAAKLLPTAFVGSQALGIAEAPALDAIRAWHAAADAARAAEAAARADAAARLLLEARAHVDAALAARKRALRLVGHQDLIRALAEALTGPRGDAAAAALRARYPCALVDEFQDTDPLQWAILRRLYAGAGDGMLCMIGDPKQAIYAFRGGDVHTYLAARAAAAPPHLALTENFRSGAGVVGAVNALFAPAGAFVETGIDYPPARPARPARALRRGGKDAPGLTVWSLPPRDDGKPRGKNEAQRMLLDACVAAIVALLDEAGRGAAALVGDDGGTEPLRADDLAVLVGTNAQALDVQQALARAGVAAVCQLQASVFAGAEAKEVLLLLQALLDPADAGRARAALATLLLGGDAAAIAALDDADGGWDDALDRLQRWRDDWQRQGPLPMLHARIAEAAPRLLALADGARRVSNYLQLAELLQEHPSFAAEDLVAWLAQAIEAADTDAESGQLRLESDAPAVRVATVHVSKGLEYGVVFLPFAGLGRDASRRRDAVPLAWYHDAAGRACAALGSAIDDGIRAAAAREALAEEVRKLYVAATRAKAACVLAWGAANTADATGLGWLLHRAGRDGAGLPFDADGCARALAELERRGDGHVALAPLPQPATPPRRAASTAVPTHAARRFAGSIERGWWTWSFTRLAQRDGAARADVLPGAADDDRGVAADAERDALDRLLAGARFGSAFHAVLEQADFAAWRGRGEAPPAEHALIERCLRREGLQAPAGVAIARVRERVGALVAATLNAPLPCGVRLADLAPARRSAEMEFHLRLAPTRSDALLALLQAHGYLADRAQLARAAATLRGLLTGIIDLVFEHAGRYWIVDYKTNRLPAYDAAALAAAVRADDYDLQYLLYTLALHRWLGVTLAGYDYDRHIGGAYYLFVRGLPAGGVYADRPPRALIEALDALFDGAAGEAA